MKGHTGPGRGIGLFLTAVFLLAAGIPALAGEEDERAIRAIFDTEIAEGIRMESADLFFRSYLPDAKILSFQKGEVSVKGYRAILEADFLRTKSVEVTHEVVYIRPEGDRFRAKVLYREEGVREGGAPFTDRYHRYYLLEREGNIWKISRDGYNESLKEIKSFHKD